MLTELQLKNFKRFECLKLPLRGLTLLSGMNSMGKSTIIQSLLVLRQTFERGHLDKGIFLNGLYTNIGVGRDLLFHDASEEEIVIQLSTDTESHAWHFHYEPAADYLEANEVPQSLIANPSHVNLFDNQFDYLSAERLAPQPSYTKSYYDVHVRKQLGMHGEYAPHYLFEMRKDKLENPKVLHPNEHDPHLLPQTEQWLNEISPGTRINFEDHGHANTIGLLVGQGSSYYSVANVGFGVSYVLPIIIALLKSRKGSLVILENPEAHLHPAGQRKMGELISRAVAGGVQVILETHSDHVLNGIRLSTKQNIISPEQTALYYLCSNGEHNYFENPELKIDGRLTFWPSGFFDEWDKAIDAIF